MSMDKNIGGNNEPEKEDIWKCDICGKRLSRLQRLESHLLSFHHLEAKDCSFLLGKRKYKLHEYDPDAKKPRTSKWRESNQPNSGQLDGLGEDVNVRSQCQESNKSNSEQFSDNGEDVNVRSQYHESNQSNSGQLVRPGNENVMDNNSLFESNNDNSTQEENYDSDSSDSSVSDVCSVEELSDSDSDCEGENTTNLCTDRPNNFITRLPNDSPELTEKDEKCLAMWAYILRHRITDVGMIDALKLFPLLSGIKSNDIKMKDMNKFLDGIDIKIHDVCQECNAVFPEDKPDDNKCATIGCNGLRYKGDESKRVHKHYFVSLPVVDQMKEILSRPGNWEAIQAHKATKSNDPNVITDIQDGTAYKDIMTKYNTEGKCTLTLSMNTDGALLFKSSHVDIWPVFLVINELPPKLRFARINMITWGLWQTPTKPNFSSYLIPLCKELIELKSNGFEFTVGNEKQSCKALLILSIVDLMAKAPLLGMTYHNGKYGCLTCEESGNTVQSGGGNVKSYPPRENYKTRTDEDFRSAANYAVTSGTEERGIRNISPLISLSFFEIVKSVVPDYMHGILLGVTKQLLKLWTKPKFSKRPFSLTKKLDVLTSRLCQMKPNDYIGRMPRTFLRKWKASEYQGWLLFFGLPCLEDILPPVYYEHFALLVSAVYKLLKASVSADDLDTAKEELNEFYRGMNELYGIENCGLNVHNVGAHIVDYVRMWGPLWAWSCFCYEDMNGNLIASVHGTLNVTIKALKTLQMQKILRTVYVHMKSDVLRKFVFQSILSSRAPRNTKPVNGCSIAGGLKKIDVPQIHLDQLAEYVQCSSDSFLKCLRIVKQGHIFFSSEYRRMQKRVCNIALIRSPFRPIIGIIRYFLVHVATNRCFAVFQQMNNAEVSFMTETKAKHIITLTDKTLSGEKLTPVENIREKLMFIECADRKYIMRMHNFHGLSV